MSLPPGEGGTKQGVRGTFCKPGLLRQDTLDSFHRCVPGFLSKSSEFPPQKYTNKIGWKLQKLMEAAKVKAASTWMIIWGKELV